MARAHFVQKAAKDYPEHGITKGQSYYWWKFMSGGRGGPKQYSATQPRQSQLTQSEFWGAVYGAQEDYNRDNAPDPDDLEDEVSKVKDELQGIHDDVEGKHSNLPDSLQNGAAGERLQGRMDAIQEAVDAIDSVDLDLPEAVEADGEETEESAEARRERAEEAWGEVVDALEGISCD